VPRKVILTVIDGLGPELLDRAIESGRAPAIERLQQLGSRSDLCTSTFPSLTPVCLAALVTGRHPEGSGIPSMTWYHRGERRIVEYGSSFAATLAEGTRQMLEDVLVNFNLVHMSPSALTVFESLDDAGLVTAAVNTYVCRGRVRHPITRPTARRLARRLGIVDAVYGPRRYFFGELFASDHTGAPRNFGGSVDRHSGHVGRWLVTRDGFDFLFLYFYETDAAQHRAGDVIGAVERADAGIGLMVEAAGGWTSFLERYAVAVVADHSQSSVEEVADLAADTDLRLFRSSRRDDPDESDLALTASNRVAMAYLLPGARLTASEAAHRLARNPAADVTMWREGGWYAVRREGGEMRFRRGGDHVDARGGTWSVAGDRDLLDPGDYPNALERIDGSLGCARTGDVVVSARLGWEFADSGGRHHAGGGSHGSLRAEDSLVPLITAGFEAEPGVPAAPSITDLTPLVERHLLGVGTPAAKSPIGG
jgi:hypothetical protein